MIKRLIRWATADRAGTDDGARPIQNVNYMGKTGPALVCLPYGLHANVPANRLGVLLSVMGIADQRGWFPMSPTKRPANSPAGEVVLYCPENNGTQIRLKPNGDIEVVVPGDLRTTVAGGAAETVAGNKSSVTQGSDLVAATGAMTVGSIAAGTVLQGVTVAVTASGAVTIAGAPTVTLTATTVAVVADLTVTGTIVATGAMTAAEFTAGAITLTGHVHSGPFSGNTDPPS